MQTNQMMNNFGNNIQMNQMMMNNMNMMNKKNIMSFNYF